MERKKRKSVRVEIEDLEKQLTQLRSEFTAKHAEMKEGLKLIAAGLKILKTTNYIYMYIHVYI